LNDENRGSWYLVTGLLLGVALGLLLAWVILPVRYAGGGPEWLTKADRDVYRGLIARAYLAEGDTPRSLARLALLKEKSPDEELSAEAQRVLIKQGDQALARALTLLAAAVNQPMLHITPLPTLPGGSPTQAP